MSSPSSVLGQHVADALISGSVAAAADVAALTWASATTPRIFRGIAGYMGGRNRGRLPFIEYSVGVNALDQVAIEGGTIVQTLQLRVHCGTASQGDAEDLTAAILLAAIAAIRDASGPDANLAAIGNEQMDALVPGPWGLMRDATLTVEQTYNRSTYEVQ